MNRTSTRPRSTSVFKLRGAIELFAPSRSIILKNFWIFAPLYTIPLIFTAHAWIWTPAPGSAQQKAWWTDYSWFGSGFFTSVPTYGWYIIVGFSVFWLLFVLAAGTVMQVMAQKAQLDGAEGHRVAFSRLVTTLKELGWRMLGLYLLITLYVLIGLILFIIPGLILLHRYFLAPYVMLDKKCSIKMAMEKSSQMAKHNPRSIWTIIGVMAVIGFLNIIPYLGWFLSFILGALYSAAPALRYLELRRMSR